MNLTLPHSWLKEYLTTNASPPKIAECLSLCGPSVEKLTKTKDDYIYELEVTTNRVDMMSVLGIAREAAAILPQFGFQAKFMSPKAPAGFNPAGQFPLKVQVDHRLCPRFAAVVIKNVTLKPSPLKIKDRLEKSGVRSLNNVVDISNYLMHAFGQPVHTFDFDKIKSTMILRLSRPGETITTLDEKTFTLPGGDIVIEDGTKKLIDLCGIMGGFNSAIDDHTKNVLLFVQTYDPVRIRQTSMKLAQRTEAAVIFEKSPDPEQVMPVLIQGIQLFKQLADAKQGSKIIDLYPHPYQPKTVTAPLQLIKQQLGVEISQLEVDKILHSLGFINGRVPSWRAKDIDIPEDIVEEVARIYGYHRLPSEIMATPIPTNYPDTHFELEYKIKTWLAGMGLTEIYTNSLVSHNRPGQLKIKNALSTDWQYLRNSLIPSHTQSFPAFEIAHIYLPRQQAGLPRPGKLPEEKLQLIISGFTDFSKLKGVVDALFAKLHLPISHTDFTAANAVIDLEPVLNQATFYPTYKPLSSYAPIIEELTFTLPERTYLGPVIQTIKNINHSVASVHLYSCFENNFTFRITYQSLTKQLSTTIIVPIRKKIVQTLAKKFNAILIGDLR